MTDIDQFGLKTCVELWCNRNSAGQVQSELITCITSDHQGLNCIVGKVVATDYGPAVSSGYSVIAGSVNGACCINCIVAPSGGGFVSQSC
jgi:hypothetical protein